MEEHSILYKLRYTLLKSDKVRNVIYKLFYKVYGKVYVPYKAAAIRKKKQIRVLFVLSELSLWKTEDLYLAMLSDNRFEPAIILEPVSETIDYEQGLLDYLKNKNYKFVQLDQNETIKDKIHPDIIFYQRPYGTVLKKNDYYRNLYALFCYASYGFHSIKDSDYLFFHKMPLNNLAWQNYFENELALKHVSQFMPNKAKNCIVTGLPMTDAYLRESEEDPWKPQDSKKKRIIWAPHHTISNQEWLYYSTFLQYYDFMIEMAIKYKDKVQFVFKPHPSLKRKLDMMWGKEKADSYYKQWDEMNTSQYEGGKYVDLFKTSDAMIHDCGSFTIEYHFTKKPVMYLVKDNYHVDGLNEFGKLAFNLHYIGRCKEDIEAFINNVIEGKDEMKTAREYFYNNYLLPPYGHSASENIIKAILG